MRETCPDLLHLNQSFSGFTIHKCFKINPNFCLINTLHDINCSGCGCNIDIASIRNRNSSLLKVYGLRN